MRATRAFFDAAGYLEVDTPQLLGECVIDAWLEPLAVLIPPSPELWQDSTRIEYLQTSPELALKQLVVAGATAIYQLGHVFRGGEFGPRHRPEFMMLEWYLVGDDDHTQMDWTEQLVRHVCSVLTSPEDTQRRWGHQSFERLTYDTAFERYCGRRVLDASTVDLHQIAACNGLVPPPGLDCADRDGWLNFLLAELVEPHLGRDRPVFLTEYPGSQAALAQTRPDPRTGQPVAARFELYVDGVELCNGYHELGDPVILADRQREQQRLRMEAGLRPLPLPDGFLAAHQRGLPPCTGVALGFDRLLMIAVGAATMGEVLPYPPATQSPRSGKE